MDKIREHVLYKPSDFHPEENSTLSTYVINGGKFCKVCGCHDDMLKTHYNCDMYLAYNRFVKGYVKNRPDLSYLQALEKAEQAWYTDILPLY